MCGLNRVRFRFLHLRVVSGASGLSPFPVCPLLICGSDRHRSGDLSIFSRTVLTVWRVLFSKEMVKPTVRGRTRTY